MEYGSFWVHVGSLPLERYGRMRGMGFGIPSWVSQLVCQTPTSNMRLIIDKSLQILRSNWRAGAVNITIGSGREAGWKQAAAWLLGAVSRTAWLQTQLHSDRLLLVGEDMERGSRE